MQKAAKIVVEEYDGVLPASYEELRSLPGIGNYTAGAIASIAYGIVAPAVDGNVLRVVSRLTENDGDIMKQSVRRQVEEELLTVIPKECPGDFTQAMMELGATICGPNKDPLCMVCPIASHCQACLHGTTGNYPVKAPKKQRTKEKRTVLVIQDGAQTALRKRPATGLLAGLYELPNVEGHLSVQQVIDYVKELNLDPLHVEQLEDAKHIFSHIEWQMTGYRIRVASLEDTAGGGLIFADRRKTAKELAIPSAFGAYTKYMGFFSFS
jgi:A/G-specific adenine glycosylase